MSPGKFSVNNPVPVNILMISLLILGFLSVQRLPKEQFSEVPFFWVNIIVPYPGAAAEDIEQSVTVHIEDEMQGLDELKQIQSVTSEGLSVVRVEFNDGIDNDKFDTLFQEVRTRFSRVDLPDGTAKETIDDFSSADFLPVIEVVLSGDAEYGILNSHALELKDKLNSIKEVGNISLIGSREKQISVILNSSIAETLGIGINEITSALSRQNLTVPGGTLETENREYLLRTIGELKKPEDFSKLIVRRGGSSGIVRVRDIADVLESYADNGVISRFNGETAITLQVAKIPGGNSVGVIDEVKKVTNTFSEKLPPGIKLSLLNDSTVQIVKSISTLVNNALWGLFLLIIILYFFVGLRNALITGLGIPVTFAATFLVLEWTGETFNTNTLFGLVLVLGLVVDHAIVIIENSYRLQQEGMDRHTAAIKGADQVVIPVTAATLTTVAAFLPLMILPGTIGKFLRVIPFTVTIALLTSTAEAVFLLPSHYADWPGKEKRRKRDLFESLKGKYSVLVKKLIAKKKMVVAAVFLFMAAVFSLTGMLKQDLFSAEDYTYFSIDIEMPPGTTLEKTLRAVKDFEDVLIPMRGNGEIVSILSSVGFSGSQSGNSRKSNLAQITVDLSERDEGRERSISLIMDEIKKKTSHVYGLDSVNFTKAVNGPPTSPPVSFRIFGDSYEDLQDASRIIKEKLSEYPELMNIRDNLEKGSPELQIRVDQEKASRYGLSVADIGSTIRSLYDGTKATSIFWNNEIVDVVVLYDKKSSNSVFDIENMIINTPDGRKVPFSSVADIVQQEAFASIKRVEGKREITIESGAYFKDNIREINSEVEKLFNSDIKNMFPGIELVTGGEFSDFNDLIFRILRIFLIGIFLIYLILGTQFKSYLQPFIILLSVPFAFTGIVLYLFISGTPFSTTVMYAGVALAGIAVNDSIVLISFINELRENGEKTESAVIKAATTRLRPIILTSLTTISGLLPTALGIGGRSVVWGPMASTIIFGLIFSTLTALFLIPLLYGIFYNKEMQRKNREVL